MRVAAGPWGGRAPLRALGGLALRRGPRVGAACGGALSLKFKLLGTLPSSAMPTAVFRGVTE